MNELKQLFDLADDRNKLYYAWLKNILTLATGTLALLVSLRHGTHLAEPQKYFLVASWIFLGIGIIFGASSIYGEVALATALTKNVKKHMLETYKEPAKFEAITPIVAQPHWFWKTSQYVMCFSLILAIIALVTYATIDTIQA
jgi:hypothetical protein